VSYLAHNYPSIRVALVGCGRWGTCLAETLTAMPEFELNWVCDPVVRWPGSRWAPLLTEDVCREVDAVLVATPAGEHLAPTLMALQSRKPVLVEKPFVQSLAEVRQIREARGETLIMVGHLLMYHPAYRALSEQVGRLHAAGPITVDVIRHSPPRGIESRCPWWTMAPHDLALLTNMFGTPLSMQVQRQGQRVRASLSWHRAQATLEYSTTAAVKTRRWRIQDHDGETSFDEQTRTMSWPRRAPSVLFEAANPLREELRHFAQCVHSGATPLTGLEQAKQSVHLLCWGDRQLRPPQSRAPTAESRSSAFDNP
jgi:UDP-2-acetamido-3-amino-2,3-dideoxy-glucuronate N-acetyltransferase